MDQDVIARTVLSGPEAIIAANRDGAIVYWNAGAERVFGHTPAEAVGQSLDLIIPERLRDRHWRGWGEVMDGRASRYGAGDLLAVPSVRKDGTSLSVEFTIAPIQDEDGTLIGIAATLRDVTERFLELRRLRSLAVEQAPG